MIGKVPITITLILILFLVISCEDDDNFYLGEKEFIDSLIANYPNNMLIYTPNYKYSYQFNKAVRSGYHILLQLESNDVLDVRKNEDNYVLSISISIWDPLSDEHYFEHLYELEIDRILYEKFSPNLESNNHFFFICKIDSVNKQIVPLPEYEIWDEDVYFQGLSNYYYYKLDGNIIDYISRPVKNKN